MEARYYSSTWFQLRFLLSSVNLIDLMARDLSARYFSKNDIVLYPSVVQDLLFFKYVV